MDEITKVKSKREFSQLPDSFVEGVLELNNWDVKETRAFLRKYVGAFLTNKVWKLNNKDILHNHMSSTNRNYNSFYRILFGEEEFKGVVDLGCGVNGFSYSYLQKVLGDVDYVGVEVVGQLVDKTNAYFKEEGFENAKCYQCNLLELEKVMGLEKEVPSPKVILMLQVIDALESFERNYSKKLLTALNENLEKEDMVVLTMSRKSLSGKTKFQVKRNWLRDFIEENFDVEEVVIKNESIFKLRKRN